jgi:lipoate-protein ligase A
MYSLVLRRDQFPVDGISDITASLLERIVTGLAETVPHAFRAGISDLCLAEKSASDGTLLHRKFSGNSMRLRPSHVLFHGTILYAFNLSLISRYLKLPERQPEYRQQRSHSDFITNLGIDVARIKQSLARQWRADNPLVAWPADLTQSLARSKYETPEWNLRF